MEQEQNKPSEKPIKWKFYRELTPQDEALISGLLQEHPTLTRGKCLEMLEYAGY